MSGTRHRPIDLQGCGCQQTRSDGRHHHWCAQHPEPCPDYYPDHEATPRPAFVAYTVDAWDAGRLVTTFTFYDADMERISSTTLRAGETADRHGLRLVAAERGATRELDDGTPLEIRRRTITAEGPRTQELT